MTALTNNLCIWLLAVLLAGALPLAAAGQTVGVVLTGNPPYYDAMYTAFAEALTTDTPLGANIQILTQKPFPDPIALSNAARKLIAADVEVIVAFGSPAVLAVLHEKSRIPVVYAGVYDPAALPISGPEVTGCGYKVPLSSLLRYLRDIRHLAVLDTIYCSYEEDSSRQLKELQNLAGDQNIQVHAVNIRNQQDISTMAGQLEGDAVFITGSSVVHLLIDQILPVLKQHRQPSAFILPDHNGAGVTVTLFQSPVEQGRITAGMTARILAGEKPAVIPPVILRNTELVFNLKEAQNIGVKIPIKLIVEATRVIK